MLRRLEQQAHPSCSAYRLVPSWAKNIQGTKTYRLYNRSIIVAQQQQQQQQYRPHLKRDKQIAQRRATYSSPHPPTVTRSMKFAPEPVSRCCRFCSIKHQMERWKIMFPPKSKRKNLSGVILSPQGVPLAGILKESSCCCVTKQTKKRGYIYISCLGRQTVFMQWQINPFRGSVVEHELSQWVVGLETRSRSTKRSDTGLNKCHK